MTEYIDMQYLRNDLIRSLMQECPIHKDNPEDCQLYSIRRLSVESKDAVIKSLTDKECMDIYIKHQACLFDKTSKIQN